MSREGCGGGLNGKERGRLRRGLRQAIAGLCVLIVVCQFPGYATALRPIREKVASSSSSVSSGSSFWIDEVSYSLSLSLSIIPHSYPPPPGATHLDRENSGNLCAELTEMILIRLLIRHIFRIF